MENNYKAGDTLELNSGGPKMTIEFIKKSNDGESNMINCSWFTGAELKRESFYEAALKPYKAKSIL